MVCEAAVLVIFPAKAGRLREGSVADLRQRTEGRVRMGWGVPLPSGLALGTVCSTVQGGKITCSPT